MKYLNKLAVGILSATIGLMTMTSCEGGDLYEVGSPDWLQDKIDSIAANKGGGEEFKLPDLPEDVYTVGATDFSTGWWAVFSKYYVIPEGKTWNMTFSLNINPSASNTYKNFALIICNDCARSDGSYKEYGAIRYDYQPSGNSEWGDYIDRSLATSNLEFASDTDEGIQKLGGKVWLQVDRSSGGLIVTINNGTVKKTYTQTTPLVNLNDDESDTNIRCFLVPEGSYFDVIGSDIEPIGGYTSKEDKQPVSMTLNSLPKKVLVNSDFKDAFANVTATVNYQQGVSQTIPMDQIAFTNVDLTTTGTKKCTAIYYSTFKGEKASAPVYQEFEFQVVDKMYDMLGSADNATPWWGAHSANVKVNPKETVVQSFYNYTSGANNWNNFVVVLCKADNTEDAVVRSDNYGWGTGYATCTATSDASDDWATWLKAMDGAKVTTYVTNNGDGTADVKAVMVGTNGVTYHQSYTGITIADPNDFYYRYTVDNCHLEFSDVLGAEDNTTAWWGAHSDNIQVPQGYTVTRQFYNYTSGANNWNNWVAVLCKADNTEYAVLRSDNYGWGTGYDACTPSGGQSDWATWLKAMDEAKVTVSVTNNGTTADLKAVMVGNNGVTYTQSYTGVSGIDANDFYYRFTVDNCHLIFEPYARDAAGAGAKRAARRGILRR